jgi:hypothetical protein
MPCCDLEVCILYGSGVVIVCCIFESRVLVSGWTSLVKPVTGALKLH